MMAQGQTRADVRRVEPQVPDVRAAVRLALASGWLLARLLFGQQRAELEGLDVHGHADLLELRLNHLRGLDPGISRQREQCELEGVAVFFEQVLTVRRPARLRKQ